MPDKEPFTSALGTFWVHGAPDHRMPGHLTIDGFPRLELFDVGTNKTIATAPRQTILGVTDRGDYVSLFGTLGSGSFWTKKRESFNGLRSPELQFGVGVNFTANTMVIGQELHTEESKVFNITFTSAVSEKYLHLNASEMLESLKFRESKWDKSVTVPITTRKLRTIYVPEKKLKISLCINALPNESSSPKARWQIDFREGTSLDIAIRAMQDFRDLISVLCNDFADIQSPMVTFRDGNHVSRTRLVFYNFKSSYDIRNSLTVPMISLAGSSEVFVRVLRSWISEEERNKIARRAFISTLLDQETIRISDVREIVTLLEMKAREKFKPLSSAHFKSLRYKMQEIVDEEMAKESIANDLTVGLETIRKRLENLNSKDAKPGIKQLIEIIPADYRQEIIADAEITAKQIVDLRNDATHDLSRLTNKSYQTASDVVHLLRWIYVVLDVIELGISVDEIHPYFTFHRVAMNLDKTLWSKE